MKSFFAGDRSKNRLLRALAVTLGLFPAAALAAPETVTFAAPGSITFAIAAETFGQEAGFFEEENLKFDLVLLKGSGEVLPQLVRGGILTSMLTPDTVISSRQPGKPNFPVHFTYNIMRRSTWQMAVLDSSPIRSFADMKGKTIGVGGLTFANVLQTKALLRRNNVDPATVNFVAVGSSGPALETLRRGQVDALNLFESAHAALEAQGVKIRRLEYPPEFSQSSSHGLVFSDKTIRERPDLVVRFGRALAKSTVGCQANLDGCLAAYWKIYPQQKPQGADEAARIRERGFLAVWVDSMMTFRGGPHRFGAYSDQDWDVPINSLRDGGELAPGVEIDRKTLYTNQFVEEFNKFDTEAVIKKAKAYRP